ncbi:riboflavin biosynthesis protein PYRD, chloroplastic-like [Amaranthus tricolor]|uniref:riboflavin biosynthesis protein PYRD, chloroplastic-like n=1 Tax=Amaranthus tricolor TaxID=29722 RepID=UPI00258C2BC6|nr:riboflavin biosynthesis protein PYRD, chloroplastic-like [Amaranthus tricolor]
MNFLTIINPNLKINPSVSIFGAVSGSCSVPKWVSNSNKKLGNVGKLGFDSRFNLGYKNVESFRNGRGLVEVMCRRAEIENGEEDAFYMRKCVELAKQAIGYTSPNPMVGSIIVKHGKIVGQGFHPKAGQPHAEVFALREAGDQAENATAYVTLEPCNHYGRTPPCSEALIKAKVKKVVVGMVDPNPIVCSRGINKLQEAGIEVVVGVEEDLCKKLNEAFIHKMLSGKPFVTLRYSISVNGVVLDQVGEKVTECGGYFSKLLQEYDAVIHTSASSTMAQELSSLRSQEPNARQPRHILLATNQDFLNNLVAESDCNATVFANKEVSVGPELSQKGIEVVVMDHISLDAILEYLSKQEMTNVLVDLRGKLSDLEEILEEALQTNSMQKVVVEVLPIWAGTEPEDSLSSSMMMNHTHSQRLKNLSTRIAGDSILLEGYF